MNQSGRPSDTFDPDAWEGDADDLRPFQEELLYDDELCARTFCSKHEAFAAGLYLGRGARQQDPNPT
jgi:hypothetical protein